MSQPHIAIIGAGWAGCAAAVRAVQSGAKVTLLEATRTPGGRARSVPWTDVPNGALDNGQHILIGAYTECLNLMRSVGADPTALLHRLPLDLRTPDGKGLLMRPSPHAQWATVRAILTAQGWPLGDKLRLLVRAAHWQRQGFGCTAQASVADLCQGLGAVVIDNMIAPLCIAAFNSAPADTSGAVFLRVLRDAMLGAQGGSDVLIARAPLGQLVPEPTVAWLAQQPHAQVRLGHRVQALRSPLPEQAGAAWCIQTAGETNSLACDHIVLACPAWEAARLVRGWADAASAQSKPLPQWQTADTLQSAKRWAEQAAALHHAPIATVYAWCNAAACGHLPPMQALHAYSNTQAQFAFHHPHRQRQSAQCETQTLLAFVASACTTDRAALQAGVQGQATQQLGLPPLAVVQTLVEKRATFVCHPTLQRPAMHIAPGLLACGDYVQGPYPATLEGAVRSGLRAAHAVCSA